MGNVASWLLRGHANANANAKGREAFLFPLRLGRSHGADFTLGTSTHLLGSLELPGRSSCCPGITEVRGGSLSGLHWPGVWAGKAGPCWGCLIPWENHSYWPCLMFREAAGEDLPSFSYPTGQLRGVTVMSP